MYKVFLKLSYVVIFISIIFCLLYLILLGLLSDLICAIYSEPLYGYSILLFILSFILMCITVYENMTYTPSIILLTSFLAVPLFGYLSYRVHIDLFESFFGELLSFDYPLFVWSVGTAALFTGIVVSHLFIRWPKRKLTHLWDLRRLSFLLWFVLGLSLIFTVAALARIGYIPVLYSGIDLQRGEYSRIVGRYSFKFSTLFIIASLLSAILFFLTNHKKLFLFIFVVSSLGATLYGNRIPFFIVIFSFFFIYLRFHKPKIRHLVIIGFLGCCLVVVFLIAQEYRADRIREGIKLKETIVLPFFAEYKHYAYVVNEIRQTGQYLKEDIFLGPLSMIFPRQIWALFGIDKDFLIDNYTAYHYFGRQFGDPLGIRITPIGEAYASYGIFYGVCLQMFIYGLAFGVLEKLYLKLNKLDARLCIVCFLVSLFMFLPITTLSSILERAVFFGSILLVFQIAGTNQFLDHTAE